MQRTLHLHYLNQLPNHSVRSNPFRFGLKIQGNAVPEYRISQDMNILGYHRKTTIEYRIGFGAKYQGLPGARPGAPVAPLLHKVRGAILRTRSPHEAIDIANQLVADVDFPGQSLQINDILIRQNGF